MLVKHIPQHRWDYGINWVCEIMSRTVNSRFDTHSKTPHSIVVGDIPDISEYVDFTLWDWVNVIEGDGQCEPTLAKFLGGLHSIGNTISYFILKSTCYVLIRSTAQPITNIEREIDGFKYNTKVCLDRTAVIMNNSIHIIANNKLSHIIPIEEDKDFILEYRNSTLNNDILEPDSDS